MRVRFLGFPDSDRSYAASGRPGCEPWWAPGEVRDVPQGTADYLKATFPGLFEGVPGPRPRAVAGPPRDRAIKSPPPRPLVEPSPTDILDNSIPVISRALATGAYDGSLDALGDAERAGKTRKGVLTLVSERKALVGA